MNTYTPTDDNGWYGVDLDGTLAYYDKWRGVAHIGDPIPKMYDRVKQWMVMGRDVRIFTARSYPCDTSNESIQYIKLWCVKHFGFELPITHMKDQHMLELWDDRVVQINKNTGDRSDGKE